MAAEGHRLVIVGVSEFTSILTVTFWVLLAAGTPDAVMTIFPVYAVALGVNALGSADTVRVVVTPGNTTPLAGLTDNQVTPEAAAVNSMALPVVFNCTVCDAGGVGGEVKLREAPVRVSVGRGAVTTSVTGMTAGLAKPVAVTWTLSV
jgi:hypothetical protein